MLRVRVLGELALEMDGEEVEPPPGRRARELVGWLALNPGTHARSELAARFWPDVLDSSARASLRTALHELRRALGDGAHGLVATRERVGFEGEPWVDALEFRRLAAEGRLEEALALVRGEVLAGLDEDWVLAARDEQREALARAYESLAADGEAAGDAEQALRWTRELVRLDPLSEDANRRLMTRLAAAGDRPAALAAYDRLADRLRRELGMAPSRPTRELAERLRSDSGGAPGGDSGEGLASSAPYTPTTRQAPGPAPLPPPLRRRERSALVGRAAELERARELVADAFTGDRRLVLVTGEPGIGKTRMLAELCRAVHDRGATVLYGRCYEEALGPYQPFAEAFSDYVRSADPQALQIGAGAPELARLGPRLADRLGEQAAPAAGDAEGARFRLFEAVIAVLERAARSGPVLVAIDDLHWADRTTLLLLGHVVRSAGPGVAVAGAYRESELARTHPLAATLADLRREGLAERVALRGLEQGDVAGLVSAWIGPEAPPELTGAIHHETGGNPFFVEEVLRNLAESGAIRRRGARWVAERGVGELGIPEGVKEVIGRRLSRLGEDANRVLAAAAAIGRTFELALLERLADLREIDVLASLEEALAAQLVREEPGRPGHYAFAHPLIHETLYDELSLARRVRLHGSVAQALEQLHPDLLVQVARHRIEAAPGGDAGRAVTAALLAARHDLGRLAYEEAADICARALEVAPEDGARVELLLVRGDALSRAGDPAAARESFRQAAAAARGLGRAGDLARAALGASGLGVTIIEVDRETVALLEEALAAVGEWDAALRARLLSRLTIELYYGSSPEGRRQLGRAAVEAARTAGDHCAEADALGALHVALWDPDGLDERLEVSAEMVEVARRAGDRERELQAHNWCVLDLLEAGNLAGVDAEIEEHERLAVELRLPGFRWWSHSWRAMRSMLEGRYDDARAELGELRIIAERTQDANALLFHGLGQTHLEGDDGVFGDDLLAFMRERMAGSPAGYAWRGCYAWGCATAGRLDEAREHLRALAADDFAAVRPDMNRLAALAEQAEALWLVEEPEIAAALYEAGRRWSGRFVPDARAAYCYGSSDLALGMLAAVAGRHDDAERHLEAALRENGRVGARPWEARTQARHGELLLRRGRPEDGERAARMIESAAAIFRELGLSRSAERAAALLQAEAPAANPR